MKLEQQVCTLSQAKRLKELGVEADTFFTWLECAEFDDEGSKVIKWHPVLFYNHNLDMYAVPGDYSKLMGDDDFHDTRGNWPAFTVAELGQMLPRNYASKLNQIGMGVCWIQWISKGDSPSNRYGDTEAEARANMLIHLLSTHLLTADEANKRLKG